MAKSKFAVGAIIGAVVGVVAGILTAPKSGKETRADLRQKATDLKDETVKRAHDLKGRAEEVVSNLKKKAVK